MIYETAGDLGVDPAHLTLRKLLWMQCGRDKARWNHTATICWALATFGQSPLAKRVKLSPDDFNPYAEKKRRVGRGDGLPINRHTIGFLKAFVPRKNGSHDG